MKKVRIICRSSQLSLLQAELVKQKILSVQPATEVEIIGRTSRGDRELHVNLSALDGTDFFTEEIFDALRKGEADIAVHSLKDMSALHFFSHPAFAVVDRDDPRDLAIFNPDILDKIKSGETIVVGTCSPRREEMAISFLKKALPQLHTDIKIETKSIRGNVESRLQQLHDGKFDATILATAGLNRLWKNEVDENGVVHQLLKDKYKMLLPLIECVPAPCQGAIVAEAHPLNEAAVELLGKINEPSLFEDAYIEKKQAWQYGTGCLQKFGVTTIQTTDAKRIYAAGGDQQGLKFNHWTAMPAGLQADAVLFSSTDYMKGFFKYAWSDEKLVIEEPVVFVANYKSLNRESDKEIFSDKKIYAAGTRTWFELAKSGYWVEGCADALGFEWFLPALQMPILNIQQTDICILTHREAAIRWQQKGYKAVSNYELHSSNDTFICQQIKEADFIFWTSFSQYETYGNNANTHVIHACAGGETASLLKQQGLDPVLFPTIKSFEQWRKYSTQPHNVA